MDTRQKLEKIRELIGEVLKELPEQQGARSLSVGDEFSALKALLESNEWPQAVPDLQMADEESESDKDDRAEGIADILLPPLSGKRFLDFGCGEGHLVNHASKFAEVSVGYDVVRNPRSRFSWEQADSKTFLTTDLKSAESKGPYDVILIYDVLDHAIESTPGDILERAKSMLSDSGRIYLRTHPWSSRHGGHAYRKINKAFVHLVFTKEELSSLGFELEENVRVIAPIYTYESWIEDAGLRKCAEPQAERHEVEAFFSHNHLVRERILKSFGLKEWSDANPSWQMSQCFWDYVLEKK